MNTIQPAHDCFHTRVMIVPNEGRQGHSFWCINCSTTLKPKS